MVKYIIYGAYNRYFSKISEIHDPIDSFIISYKNEISKLVPIDVTNIKNIECYEDSDAELATTLYIPVPENKLHNLKGIPYILEFEDDNAAELYYELMKGEYTRK